MTKTARVQGERSTRSVPSWKTVVVIDDLQDLADTLVMLLELEGYHVIGANNGVDGLNLAVQNHADLVLLDYLMPGVNGAEVGMALRANPVTADVKILISSATPEDVVRRVFDAYDAFLPKPYHATDMLEQIATLLDGRR